MGVKIATVVIVHFGDVKPTLALVDQIADYGCDLVIVANDRLPRPPGLDTRIEWHIPERNLGYGEAFNEVAQGRRTAVLVLLNTDLVVPRQSFERCIDVLMSDESIGIVGPVLRLADGSLQSGAAELTRWRRAPRVVIDPGPGVADCTWVTGAVMFMRREVAEQVGMDGSYFLGGEDADLCVRARRAGWRTVCCGDAEMTHHRSQVISADQWSYYSIRNRVWFARANFGWRAGSVNWLNALASLPRIFIADVFVRRSLRHSVLTTSGMWHATRGKPRRAAGPLPGEPLAAGRAR